MAGTAHTRGLMDAVSLHELQRWMKKRIHPRDNDLPAAPGLVLNAQRGTPGEERLAVYASGYLIRIREALAEAYPATRHVLGDGAFFELASDYACSMPSQDYNLNHAGRQLPAYLSSASSTSSLPFLPDLARLEWLVCEAFHAFDHPPLDPTRFSSLPLDAWDRAQLALQPSVGFVASQWPIRDIWEARTTPREAIDIDLVDRPQRVLVFRRGVTVCCELITEPQQVLLEALFAGRLLGQACAALANRTAEASLPVAEWFASWMRNGLFHDIRWSESDAPPR